MAAIGYAGTGDYYPYATTATSAIHIEWREVVCDSTVHFLDDYRNTQKPKKDKLRFFRRFIPVRVQNYENTGYSYPLGYKNWRFCSPRNAMSVGQKANHKRKRSLHELAKRSKV